MKRWIFVICALLLLPALAFGEGKQANETPDYVDIKTLREQADFVWQKQYTDDYGRSVSVDVVPILPRVERVPVLLAESPVITSENVYNVFPPESMTVSSNEATVNYDGFDDESGASVHIWIGTPESYSTPNCADIFIDYDQRTHTKTSAELHIDQEISYLPNEVSFDTRYLGEGEWTLQECMEETQNKLSAFFPDYDLQFDLFRVGVITGKYYACVLRQKMQGIPILMGAKDPVVNTDKSDLGFDVPEEWRFYYRHPWGMFQRPSWALTISQAKFEIMCRPLKEETEIVSDVPLCNMDRVIKTVERKIQEGHIRNVYSLRFGYCCYFDGDEDIVLYPVWEIECDYMFNPKNDMVVYREDSDVPVTSRHYYRTMIVNAQTGEFMDPIELKEHLLDCPEIIRWEDVQS